MKDTLDKKYKYIYKITNQINGKIYVGQHATNNLKYYYKGSGVRLKEAKKKYGSENFKLEILEWYEGNSKQEFNSLERKWIIDLKSDDPSIGYNLTRNCGGGYISDAWYASRIGRKHTEEEKRKISESNKGKKITEKQRKINSERHKGRIKSNETIRKMKESKGYSNENSYKKKTINKIRYQKIEQYTLKGEYVQTFNSISDAVVFCGRDVKKVGVSAILKALSDFKYIAYGYRWKRIEINDNLERECRYNPLIVTHKYNRKNVKRIYQFTLEGEFVKEFESAADVCRELGLSNTNDIHLVCKGKRYSAKGFIWRYESKLELN